jgi:hypothetical protein
MLINVLMEPIPATSMPPVLILMKVSSATVSLDSKAMGMSATISTNVSPVTMSALQMLFVLTTSVLSAVNAKAVSSEMVSNAAKSTNAKSELMTVTPTLPVPTPRDHSTAHVTVDSPVTVTLVSMLMNVP